MGILNTLFGSSESRAREIMCDDEHIVCCWKDYYTTIFEKQEVIESLTVQNCKDKIHSLKKFLTLELVDISDEEKEDHELLTDLTNISHEKKIKRITRLEHCLDYTHTKYELLFHQLHELHVILKNEMHIISRLGQSNSTTWIGLLKEQLHLELVLIQKINLHESAYPFFVSLVRGERLVKIMDKKEKKLLQKMEHGIAKIFSNEITEGITCEWAMRVFDAIEDKVHEGVESGMFAGYHENIDFEYVNRPEFIDLVREVIGSIRQSNVSEQMITVFVHLFREWFNHGRD